MKAYAPSIRGLLMVDDERSLARLDPVVDGIVAEFSLVDAILVRIARRHSLEVVPYTVNEAHEVGRLLELGVDGVITDDPKAVVATTEAWLERVLRRHPPAQRVPASAFL